MVEVAARDDQLRHAQAVRHQQVARVRVTGEADLQAPGEVGAAGPQER